MQFTITRKHLGTTHVVYIDDEDAEKLAGRRWGVRTGHATFYVYGGRGRANLHNSWPLMLGRFDDEAEAAAAAKAFRAEHMPFAVEGR